MMLKVENLSFSYGKIQAIRDVSFTLEKGTIMSIVGANGAGKSSLMKCIAGLLKPEQGTISYHDRRLEPAPHKVVEQGICLVPEGRWIFPNLTVEENLLLGGYTNRNRETSMKRAYEMFERLDERKKQRAGTMSGGEQQMLAISRGLMSDPRILMLDEPSLGLAPIIVEEIFNMIEKVRDAGKTVLLIEQNASLALQISDYAYALELGQIKLSGTGKELLASDEIRKMYLGVTA